MTEWLVKPTQATLFNDISNSFYNYLSVILSPGINNYAEQSRENDGMASLIRIIDDEI